jgi:hypothetical protein
VDLKAQRITARSHRIVSEAVGEEVVVYDLDTDEAHLLSPNVATIWKAADGSRTVEEFMAIVESDGPEQAASIVWSGLEQLQEKRLLEGVALLPAASVGLSRRAMLKRIGIAAISIPVITTIVAPTPAAAACSTGRGAAGEPCCSTGICNTGTCTNNTSGSPSRGTICCYSSGKPGGVNCTTSNQNQCCSGSCQGSNCTTFP